MACSNQICQIQSRTKLASVDFRSKAIAQVSFVTTVLNRGHNLRDAWVSAAAKSAACLVSGRVRDATLGDGSGSEDGQRPELTEAEEGESLPRTDDCLCRYGE